MDLRYNSFTSNVNIRLLFCVLIVFLFLFSSNSWVFADQNSPSELIPKSTRCPRAVNEDIEPNNDFGTASRVEYNISGTTHIFSASVGGLDPYDFWWINASRGLHYYKNNKVLGTNNPEKIVITLTFNEINQGSNGVLITIYDAEFHKLGVSRVAKEGNPVIINLISQVNPCFFLRIQSNPFDSHFDYILTFSNETIADNPAYSDDEKFFNATEVNITVGKVFNDPQEHYLDKSHDFADFYKFDALTGQKIDIELQISSNAQDDFDLLLYDKPDANKPITSSDNSNKNEHIIHYSSSDKSYYLRVGVKNIADETLRNKGNYILTFKGNIPPKWNTSFPESYILFEDGPKIVLDLTDAFYDLNPYDLDQIKIQVWDSPTGQNGNWIDSGNDLKLKNITISLDSNKVLKVKSKPNRYGTDIIKVRATDNLGENYTYKNINLIIKPTNDPPVLNGTKKWKISKDLTPSNDGKKITGQEGKFFQCTVTAYDPYDPTDRITFYDNTDIFDINPNTGLISFLAIYNFTGEHKIEITAADNGEPQINTTREFTFILEPSETYPEVELLTIKNGNIEYNLRPTFTWQQINDDFGEGIYYDFYLSDNKEFVQDLDKSALITTLKDINIFTFTSDLEDKKTYYWTIIPNDGLHRGICVSGIFSFEINIDVPKPVIIMRSPFNNQILSKDIVTLTWDVDYKDKDTVFYDVYISDSYEKLLDPTFMPKEFERTKKSYVESGLYYERRYYWKVLPYTSKVQGDASEIYSFYIANSVPDIKLVNPMNNSIILPESSFYLKWEINYSTLNKISNVLFISTSPEFKETNGINLEFNRSYFISGLDKDTYYWKVIPYLNELIGQESKVWTFTIKDVEVPKTVLIEPVDTTLYSNNEIVVVQLKWLVDYDNIYDPMDMWFDVYLDNSTHEPGMMSKVSSKNYQLSFFTAILPNELNKIYYWYVVPHLRIDGGLISGICSSGVVNFKLGEQDVLYEINISMNTKYIEVEPGSSKIVYFTLRNTGNRQTIIDISFQNEGEGFISLSPEFNTKSLSVKEKLEIALSVQILTTGVEGRYTINITATSSESTVVKSSDTFIVNIKETPSKKDNGTLQDRGLFDDSMFVWAIITIIIILITLFLYTKIKRHKLLEHKRREMIFNHVTENPGEHFRAIQKTLGFEVGVLAHHINKLEREEFIKSRQDGQYRRFYPMDAKIDLKLILSQLQERILNFIKKNPGQSKKIIATSLDVDPKLINYHVRVLQKAGFIYLEERGRESLCYSAASAIS